MNSKEIRGKFLNFFEERGHKIVPSSLLIPDDPSVLLTTAGMQQFKPYYIGKADPLRDFKSRNAASVQKCFRTSDIDSVGDETHLTFFEMLGNFSFGGPANLDGSGASYFKKEAIHWAYEFIVDVLGIARERITVSVFGGDPSPLKEREASGSFTNHSFKGEGQVSHDAESFNIWHKEIGLPEDKIKEHGREDNLWGPTGNEGPCGPTTEIYVDDVEIWNLVFNEYYGKRLEIGGDGLELEKISSPGVDTGMGLERLAVMMQGVPNVFETDLFYPLIFKLREAVPKLPHETQSVLHKKVLKILADHLRASVFLVADGLRPSNKEAGYILRRLLRRILVYGIKYDIHADLFSIAVDFVKENYGEWYPEVKKTKEILEILFGEKDKFEKALALGVKEIEKYDRITAKDAFYIYETFGLPFELLQELVPDKVKNLNKADFDAEFQKHQEISRAGQEKKFGGHGLILDTGELKAANEEELKKVTRLHTATHLLQAALRKVLGDAVEQRGSDITSERTRFDFAFSRKLTPAELKKVEDLVNEAISRALEVTMEEIDFEEAKKSGALHFFREKYPPRVKVWTAGDFSREVCGGPHVKNTREVGKFVILKEEAVAAGVRRIRATVG